MPKPTIQQRLAIYALLIALAYFFTPLMVFIPIAILEFFGMMDPGNATKEAD